MPRPAPRTPLPVRAVVGLLAGLVLLAAAVLDGGADAPSRLDVARPGGASPTHEVPAPAPALRRVEPAAPDALLPPGPVLAVVALAVRGLVLLAAAGPVAAPSPAPVPARTGTGRPRRRGPPPPFA